MRRFALRLAVLSIALAAPPALASAPPRAAAPDAPRRLPPVMLWAWEHPQDLSFIDPARVGVAFLERTVVIDDAPGAEPSTRVAVRPRLQPLRVPARTALVAVVPVEAPGAAHRLTPEVRARAVDAIAAAAAFPGLAGLQVDFDAARSQRPFYRALLQDLRNVLPARLSLSMTALASWCIGDPWLGGVPVDETVPMLFRMGADAHAVRRTLAREDFPCEACRTSLGVATDEPAPALRRGRRLYVFHAGPWTARAAHAVLARVAP